MTRLPIGTVVHLSTTDVLRPASGWVRIDPSWSSDEGRGVRLRSSDTPSPTRPPSSVTAPGSDSRRSGPRPTTTTERNDR